MSATYSLLGVAINAGGIPISGFQDGDAWSVAHNADEFESVVGADGEVELNTMNDKSGVITITVQYSSRANRVFQTLADSGASFPIGIFDTTGGYSCEASACRLMKRPDVTGGRAASPVEWTFIAPQIVSTLDGIAPD